MKKFRIYFTDFPNDPLICECFSRYEAWECGYKYITVWRLDATIDRVEEVTE